MKPETQNKLMIAWILTMSLGTGALFVAHAINDHNTPPESIDPEEAYCQVNDDTRSVDIIDSVSGEIQASYSIPQKADFNEDGVLRFSFGGGPPHVEKQKVTVDREAGTCLYDYYNTEYLHQLEQS